MLEKKAWKLDLGEVWISPPNIIEVLHNHKYVHYLKKHTFLHDAPVIKEVLE